MELFSPRYKTLAMGFATWETCWDWGERVWSLLEEIMPFSASPCEMCESAWQKFINNTQALVLLQRDSTSCGFFQISWEMLRTADHCKSPGFISSQREKFDAFLSLSGWCPVLSSQKDSVWELEITAAGLWEGFFVWLFLWGFFERRRMWPLSEG